jgi:UDP-glucose 4-epimerase
MKPDNNIQLPISKLPLMGGFDGLRVLVTGGAGFIGSHLCELLQNHGSMVTVIDDLSSGKRENIPPGINFVEASIRDEKAISQILDEIDVVFHLAAIASVPLCEEDPELNNQVNIRASEYLLDLCTTKPSVKAFIFASSSAIYGAPKFIPIDELHPIEPMSNYGRAKAHIDSLVSSKSNFDLASNSGLDSFLPKCALRLFNVYGPRQDHSSPYSGVISIYLERLQNNLPITLFGDGKQTRDFVFVSDVARAFLLVGEDLIRNGTNSLCHNNSLNVSTGKALEINELISELSLQTLKNPQIAKSPPREADIMHSLGSHDNLTEITGWFPEIGIKYGLSILIDSASNQRL